MTDMNEGKAVSKLVEMKQNEREGGKEGRREGHKSRLVRFAATGLSPRLVAAAAHTSCQQNLCSNCGVQTRQEIMIGKYKRTTKDEIRCCQFFPYGLHYFRLKMLFQPSA
jgi:hypothetical protein